LSRKKRNYNRQIASDEKFHDKTVSKLINYVMKDGKKSIAKKIVYHSLDIASKKLALEPLDLFNQVVKKISPEVEVRSRRIGGSNYQVPKEIRADRKLVIALKWLVSSARSRTEYTMIDRLSYELIDIINNKAATLNKKEELHKRAEANRAFSSLNW
jgi:small subunit ribosomal protein S7